MIIDVNTSLGHYPFRQLPQRTADELVRLMDRNGLDRAVVSSLHAVFYRDAQRGNEELMAATRVHGGRFVPVATVNPAYVGWDRDLAQCVQEWKVKAVTLVPEHHGYSLTDDRGRAALARIAEYGVPVVLRQRFEDRRQRHAWDKAEDLDQKTLLAIAGAHPTLKLLLVNWLGLDGARLAEAGLKGRVLIDIARPHVVFRKDVLRLIDTLGADAVAFGSHLPFEYVAPSLIKLANLQLWRPDVYEAVAWRNAAKFLSLSV